jgi:hypothetical protein
MGIDMTDAGLCRMEKAQEIDSATIYWVLNICDIISFFAIVS